MNIALLGISVDAVDAARLANFWAQALQRTVDDGATEDFASIAADRDSERGPFLMFHKVPEGKTVKNRVHFRPTSRRHRGRSRPPDRLGRQADSLTG